MSQVYNIQNIQNSCDISTLNIPGGSAGALVQIGNTQLVPSPFINANLEKYTVDDVVIGGVLKLQLSGIAVGNSFNEVAVSNNGRTSISDVLELSKKSDCVSVLIQCGDSAFIDGIGKITSASASEGNSPTWVNIAPYTIEIDIFINKGSPVVEPEVPTSSVDPGCDIKSLSLKEISEQFTLTIDEDTYSWGVIDGALDGISSVGRQHVKLDFSISARGNGSSGSCIDGNISGLKLGLDAAESYVRCRIDKLKNMDLSGVSSPPDQEIVPTLAEFIGGPSFLDFRSVEIDPLKSLISVNGSIIYRKPSGSCDPVSQNVFTTVTVEESLDEEGAEVTISGTITGLIDVSYDKIIKDTNGFLNDQDCNFNYKMIYADTFFKAFRDPNNLRAIAEKHKTADRIIDETATGNQCTNQESSFNNGILPSICSDPCPTPSPGLNDTCSFRLISSQVSKDYAEGQINFTFVLSNKSAASNIPGVSTVEIEGNHIMPRDTIVEQLVPGKGIVTQNLCAYSLEKWTFDISLRFTNQQRLCPTRSIKQLRQCSEQLVKDFFGCVQCPDESCSDCENIDDPITGCWFVTDKSENISRSGYRYNIEFTKPSC